MPSRSYYSLSDDEVRSVLTHDDALQVVEATYADYGRCQAILSAPPAMSVRAVRPDGADFKVKGAHAISQDVCGFRVLINRKAESGLVSYCWLFDAKSGEVLGFVEETWLHRFRTAVTAVVAAKWLAAEQSRIVTIVGAGKIADELPPALMQSFEVDELRVVSRRYETAEAFARKHTNIAPTRAVRTIDEALKGANVVIAVSSSNEPLIHKRHLSAGMTICALGGGSELGPDTLEVADKLVVDELEYASSVGSIAGWLKSGLAYNVIKDRIAANIGEIAVRSRAGRQNSNEIVLAVIQGMACCDVALANHALKQWVAAAELNARSHRS